MTAKRWKRQHREVGYGMSLKAWARYTSAGSSIWSQHAAEWLRRKA